MFVTTRSILSALALLLALLGPATCSVHAQTLTRAQVDQLLKQRLAQANALNAQIQQTVAFPTVVAQLQAALSNVQYQISILQQLRAALDQAFAVDGLLQDLQGQIVRLASRPPTAVVIQQIALLQAVMANLQASLSTIQAQISGLQAQITP
jgi:hypothetical protein